MGNGGGRGRLSIGTMVNPKICVASDPTSCGTINSAQAKSASTTVCAPQVLLANALGTSVGWADQSTYMPFFADHTTRGKEHVPQSGLGAPKELQ